jgi:ribosome-associated protein
MESQEVAIVTDEIRLDSLLKYAAIVGTGGEAKYLIQSELVAVNGAIDTRRSRKVVAGDRIEIFDEDNRDHRLVELIVTSGD